MPRIDPRDDVLFLLCEDVRQEYGNKLSILGLLSGNDILFRPDLADIAVPSLAFVFIVRRGIDGASVSIRAVGPDGKLFGTANLFEGRLSPGRPALFVTKFHDAVLQRGHYDVLFTLAENEYVFGFEVGNLPS